MSMCAMTGNCISIPMWDYRDRRRAIRYFIDEEFIENGKTIDLVSIGIVAEDGRELYVQSCEFNPSKANPFVRDNVFSQLLTCPHSGIATGLIRADRAYHAGRHGQCTFEKPDKGIAGLHTDCPWRTRKQIKQEILSFMDIKAYGKPELWGYYSAYDHVAFCQLFGTMMDLPDGFPMYTRDLKQWCDMLGNPQLPEQDEGEHHALADARWNRLIWQMLHEKQAK